MNPPAPGRRPVVVSVADPEGAGTTCLRYAYPAQVSLRFIDANTIARELEVDGDSAARVAWARGRVFVRQRESFGFETVSSDRVGGEPAFLEDAVHRGCDQPL